MTTMLEKMARAIEHAEDMGQYYEDIARAALQAIREPDQRTVYASGAGDGEMLDFARSSFTAMIDAILSEGKA